MVVGIIDINANFNRSDGHAERAAFAAANQNFAALNASVIALNNRLFNPASISGLAIWLDPTDNTTLVRSSGDLIAQINNKGNVAGVGNATQATPANQPLVVVGAINGGQALQGRHTGGIASQLDIADSVGLDYTRYTAFTVFQRVADLGGIETLSGKYATSGNQREFKQDINEDDTVGIRSSPDGTPGALSAAFTTTTTEIGVPRIMRSMFDGVNITTRLLNVGTGLATAPASVVFNGTGKYILFCRENLSDPAAVFIGEHLLFNRVLSDAESVAAGNNLLAKWSIA